MGCPLLPFTVKPWSYDYILLTPSNTLFLFEFIYLFSEKPYGRLSNNLLDTLPINKRTRYVAISMKLLTRSWHISPFCLECCLYSSGFQSFLFTNGCHLVNGTPWFYYSSISVIGNLAWLSNIISFIRKHYPLNQQSSKISLFMGIALSTLTPHKGWYCIILWIQPCSFVSLSVSANSSIPSLFTLYIPPQFHNIDLLPRS